VKRTDRPCYADWMDLARELGRRGPALGRRWPSVVRGALAALVVAAAGGFSAPQIWVLALVAGLSFFDLARRASDEPGAGGIDPGGIAMQAGFLLLLCAAAWDNRDGAIAQRVPRMVEFSGLALVAGGLELRRRAVAALGRRFTVRIVVERDHELVTAGPYRRIRHPNYAGLALVALGTALIMRSPLAVAVGAAVWLPCIALRTLHEEAALTRRFGPAYELYARRTWRLLPGVL
jgi:protein-S-isoprenylcysteine O-methyltransferase Ste14